ncbi:hypothetical protein C8A03DRAFT_33363 [Achaetomium macrosporum]|uniref:ubiquitinyl hydrolase 1 n=1 Tax=Achaetomium macrosporum TaxID=79813 RepID=A0AAN7CAS6_9PEZI|nr:hypothetical protein C8A03DRAFT_33363 [Achaetomium macrosporum]
MAGPTVESATRAPPMESLGFSINHVFLPPRVPQKDDASIPEEHTLISLLLESAKQFGKQTSPAVSDRLGPAIRMVERLLNVKPGLDMDSKAKEALVRGVMLELAEGEHVLLHMRAQNAGLLLTGCRDDILVEAFELLAPNKDVMSCEGRLIRHFPGCVAAVHRTMLHDPDFLNELIHVLRQLELQASPVTRPKTSKSGQEHVEERDTNSPLLVTDMVMGILGGLEGSRSVEPERICKRSREQVSWNSALLPFHRSLTWLLLRVALRLVLDRDRSQDADVSLYKALITFHHGRLLELAGQCGFDADLRFAMGAKLVRRISKLDPQHNVPWLQRTRDIITANHDELQRQWQLVQKEGITIQESRLKKLCFQGDAALRLRDLNKHLSWIQARSMDIHDTAGPGDETSSSRLVSDDLPTLGRFTAIDRQAFVLIELESWIESNLSSWVDNRLQLHNNKPVEADEDLSKLQELMTVYRERASGAYTGNPEALSVMYLNIMDLWVALDQIAGKAIPLILEYDPGFTSDFLHTLILPTRTQMARLQAVEFYLSRRRQATRNGYPQAFHRFGEQRSFAVRYFDSSSEHKNLLNEIQAEAKRLEALKLEEYRNKREQYDRLCAEKDRSDHEQEWDDWANQWVCISGCVACNLQNRISALKIGLFERPLPDNLTLSKAIVFEISVPRPVVIWRDVTTQLFLNVFPPRSTQAGESRLWLAADHSGLRPFTTSTSQVQLASNIKPVEASHYRGKHITMVNERNVCVLHPWYKYNYYEVDTKLPNTEVFQEPCVPTECSFAEHQRGPLLDVWTRSTSHTSNDVIASQSSCPPAMSLDEFRAFGHLRSGVRLQWANALCQLIVPSLNWNRESTFFLVLQACLDAGPPSSGGSVLREAHEDLLDDQFVDRLLDALTHALGRFRENWQNEIAVGLLACLATRALSLTTSNTLADSLLAFLSETRSVAVQWARQLREKIASCSGAESNVRRELDERVLMAALICMSTFDITTDLLKPVLGSADNLAVFLEAAIIAHDHTPATDDASNPILLFLTRRWRITMHKSLAFVRGEVVKEMDGNPGIHAAISRFWADYSAPATRWSQLCGKQEHILKGRMTREKGNPIRITLSLLHGRLLVDGYPLSRLPKEYESHPTYQQLFGNQILEVMPSTRKGMRFSACREQQGWVVHFTMAGSELVIQAVLRRDDAASRRECEFIGSSKLGSDVPASFKRNFSHWLDLATGTIEFRSASEPWVSSPNNWLLIQEGERKVLSRGGCYLIDPHSPTGEALSRILSLIESKENVDIVFHSGDRTLALDLPRFSLSFTLAEGKSAITSKHYSGMGIDKCQNIGALVGLQNKLVLREEDVPTCSTPRRVVLVPRGPLSWSKTSDHVSVSVAISESLHVKHDAFTIDPMLGRITSSGALSGKLYLCLLHAVTSHCLPDPLTGRTGTEEALRILSSASVRSFQQLDMESYDLLRQIARISPKRRFYPEHLQDMEQVEWSDKLPVLSQHEGFCPMIDSILQHAEDCKRLQQDDGRAANLPDFAPFKKSSPLLVRRAKIRNAMFRVSEFGAENYTAKFDRQYSGRQDHGRGKQGFEKLRRATLVTKCIMSGCPKLVERPSDGLREAILGITGTKFHGSPDVDIAFNFDQLQPHSKSLAGLWCSLHRALAQEPNQYKATFFLCALVYAERASWDIVQALMAFVIDRCKFQTKVTPPMEECFDLSYSMSSMQRIVKGIIEGRLFSLSNCPEANLPQRPNEGKEAAKRRRKRTWEARSAELARKFGSDLERQWTSNQLKHPPCWTVMEPMGERYTSYMNVSAIMPEVRKALDLARRTAAFEKYVDGVVGELKRMSLVSCVEFDQHKSTFDPPEVPLNPAEQVSRLGFVQSSALFSRRAPSTQRPQPADFTELYDQVTQTAGDSSPLAGVLNQLSALCGQKPYQVAYIDELRCSSSSMATFRHQLRQELGNLQSVFENYLLQCKQTTEGIRRSIEQSLAGQSIADATFKAASLYPRISPIFLLQRLTRGFWNDLPMDWRECLVNYGLSMAYLQRGERLVNASRHPDRQADLLKEILNTGSHGSEDGDPLTFPESLILELEQGILIRPVQQRIAAKMRDPPGGANSVMQLNMGEGKSSVIVPIVSASLADGNRLVRVVVAKPQSKQMMHTLIATLGGLINRRVFYLPISRGSRLTGPDVQVVQRILETCREEGGVLLVQPEHLLSFKLMCLESTWADRTRAEGVDKRILDVYRNFEDVSRDIVDESDENFSVKFELIYTMGSQQPIDMSPDRWTILQELMDVVLEIARGIIAGPKAGRVKGLLVEEGQTSRRFPTIRILEEAASKRLVHAIAEHVCRTGLRGFPVQHQSEQMRQAVLKYMLEPNPTPGQIAAVENATSGFFSEPTTKNALLLLRGLLATGVISFALGQKRFRVNYGLAPDRRPPTMLAIPYRAKDSPTPRSEFSHPDVVIVLTCLSYYYQGLSDNELRTCLEALSKSDQAEQEYSRWAAASPRLPSSLSHFSGVNLEDSVLCKQSIFPAVRYAKPAIDFYLATVVFPKEMREFPSKLSASGWDLGKATQHPLTGFSGTTDSKYVLPLSVTALDLPEQRHTNSSVLACLLREENTVLELGGDHAHGSQSLTVNTVLAAATSSPQPMRVVLDVGAQIIELSNLQVARRWLELVPTEEADAVIFFNDQDELSVLTRNGVVESFLTSPFATQTDRCLVFLDQAHTRGTDLKLPDSYRAAVTLRPGVTKDTLVQACMRMRKLGQGQSVTFCVSSEMQKRIRKLANIEGCRPLTVSDILVCAIAETWEDAHRSLPLWATQGIRHQYQEVVWEKVNKTGDLTVKDVQQYLEDEAQSLEQRYRPLAEESGANAQSVTARLKAALTLESRQDHVARIKAKCIEFGLANLDAMGNLQEEQERELAPEVERERQVQRPPAQKPAAHHLHTDVRTFALSGVFNPQSPAFLPAFHSLATTSAAALFPVSKFPSDLLVTADFARTVQHDDKSSRSDACQRPVQWLLTHPSPTARHGMHMVVISPWEANELKALLTTTNPTAAPSPGADSVQLRAYLPRTSLSYHSLEHLDTYTIPSSRQTPAPPPELLTTQLNLFSGQLYLRSYQSYLCLCQYLGLSYKPNAAWDTDLPADGFVGRARGGEGYEECEFEEVSPVAFLGVLFKRVRRDGVVDGQAERTHMGRVLAGEILREGDFEVVEQEEGEQ